MGFLKLIALLLMILLTTACSATVPVAGSIEGYNDVFLGTVSMSFIDGTGRINGRMANSGVEITGQALYMHGIGEDRGGLVKLTSSDGRTLSGQWTTDTMTSGYGQGHDASGRRFNFRFGGSYEDVCSTAMALLHTSATAPPYRRLDGRELVTGKPKQDFQTIKSWNYHRGDPRTESERLYREWSTVQGEMTAELLNNRWDDSNKIAAHILRQTKPLASRLENQMIKDGFSKEMAKIFINGQNTTLVSFIEEASRRGIGH